MYHMTVFDQTGSKLYDEPIEAVTDAEAKKKGLDVLEEKEYQAYPFRIFHSSGRLVEFQSHKAKKAAKTGA
ncbi:YhzD family protein [Salinithrix halophila]|uniref:YhzD family protein n=1 Tax=Salinithrix halophila TaxID=1485204 RepID=A0ABV8JC51_9BACL